MGLREAVWKQLECVGFSGLYIPCLGRIQHLAVPQGFCPVTSPLSSKALTCDGELVSCSSQGGWWLLRSPVSRGVPALGVGSADTVL